jgi:uncharacterized protein (TIGR03435 family)
MSEKLEVKVEMRGSLSIASNRLLWAAVLVLLRGNSLRRAVTLRKQSAVATVALVARMITIAVGISSPLAVHAQPTQPKFEVSSVKPRIRGSKLDVTECSGDRYMMSGPIFGNILQWAYLLKGDQGFELFMKRVPELLRNASYEIQGKAAGPISTSECRLMVQSLLADRFKLAFHYETVEADLYDLVVALGGPKLQPARPTDEGSDVHVVWDGRLVYEFGPKDPENGTNAKGWTMEDLALHVPNNAPLPVADKTDLKGRYKMDLRFSTTVSLEDQGQDPPFEAAIAKLGLRLQKHKGPVQVPVLDHIEAPEPN